MRQHQRGNQDLARCWDLVVLDLHQHQYPPRQSEFCPPLNAAAGDPRTALLPGIELALAQAESGVFTSEGSVVPATSGGHHLQVWVIFPGTWGTWLIIPTLSEDGDIATTGAP